LQLRLQQAIEEEDFARAARLRDAIRAMLLQAQPDEQEPSDDV